MILVEESNRQICWWRERLDKSKDWNSLPKESRKDLLNKFKQCIRDLICLDITDKELVKLVQLTDVPTVFDAVISVVALPEVEKKDRWAVLAYLTRVVLNSEKGKFNAVEPTWHREIKRRQRKGKIVTVEHAQRFNPYDFKNKILCKQCGKRINISNATGVCTKCQRKGREWKGK